MSDFTVKFSLSGTAKINFSVAIEPTLTSCENDNVSELPKAISDLKTARDSTPVPPCTDSNLEETERPVFSLALSSANGSVESLFENVSEISDTELNSVLFGANWRSLSTIPSLSVNPGDLLFNNEPTDDVVVLGEVNRGVKSEFK